MLVVGAKMPNKKVMEDGDTRWIRAGNKPDTSKEEDVVIGH